MTQPKQITRRSLLRRTSAAAAGMMILRNASSAFTFQANEKLNLAHVGVGGRGRELLLTFSRFANPLVFCDVNQNRAHDAFTRFPDVPRLEDFREMLDKHGKDIDAVIVGTPDHTHAVITAAALRAGKPVYTEKPLTRTIEESRVLRRLAGEKKLATSMGNQGTASHAFRRALELIREGAFGPVTEVYSWNDGGGPGHREPPPAVANPIPPYLNWDLWLGPAKSRPFQPRWMAWSGWRDFGTGQMGNWNSHSANLAFMALKVHELWSSPPAGQAPPRIRVEAKVEAINHLAYPRWEMITWDIPPRGDMPAVKFHWYNGSRGPGARDKLEQLAERGLDWGDKGAKKWADHAGCVIVGDQGKIHATGHNATFRMLPADKFADLKQDAPQSVQRSLGHERDFLAACIGGPPAWANFDYAGPLNEFLQLGNLATRFEGPLDYDPFAGRITNNPQANAALKLEYREGWSL